MFNVTKAFFNEVFFLRATMGDYTQPPLAAPPPELGEEELAEWTQARLIEAQQAQVAQELLSIPGTIDLFTGKIHEVAVFLQNRLDPTTPVAQDLAQELTEWAETRGIALTWATSGGE